MDAGASGQAAAVKVELEFRPVSDPPEAWRHVLIVWPGQEEAVEGFMCGTGRWFRVEDFRARFPLPVTWWAPLPAVPGDSEEE